MMHLPFVLFAIFPILELTIRNSHNPADTGRYVGLFFLTLFLMLGLIVTHFGIIPYIFLIIDNDGMHSFAQIRVGTKVIFERNRTKLWKDIERLEWFDSGYVSGFLAIGKNEFGKNSWMGPTIYTTNTMKAVRFIVDKIPNEKVDSVVLQKLEIYESKNKA